MTSSPLCRAALRRAALALVCLSACRPAAPIAPAPARANPTPQPLASAVVPPPTPTPAKAAALVEPTAPNEAELEVDEDVPLPKSCPRAAKPKSSLIDTMDWLGLFDVLSSDFPEEDKPKRPADNPRARESICYRSSGSSNIAPQLEPKECPPGEPVLEVTTTHMFFSDRTYILWPRGETVAVYATMAVSFGAGPNRPGQTMRSSATRTKQLLAVVTTTISEIWDAKAGGPRVDEGEATLVVMRTDGEEQLTISPLPPKTKVHLRGTSVVLEGPANPRAKGCPSTFEIP